MQFSLYKSILFACIPVYLLAAPTACKNIYFENQAPDIHAITVKSSTKELCFEAFAVLHSGISRTPLWSAEFLTVKSLSTKTHRTNDFHPEERLPFNERAELNDYAHSGYDRGHMSPSADMPTITAQHESFSLANMVPQNSLNNRGVWSKIEQTTRELAKEKGALFVITGPLFEGNKLERIGTRVLVPSSLYKIIFDPKTRQGAVFIVQNIDNSGVQIITIDALEKRTIYLFFPTLSQKQKQKLLPFSYPLLTPSSPSQSSQNFSKNQTFNGECQGKKTCKEMTSCNEAYFYLNHCGATHLDGDHDGIPCEKICNNK